MSRQRERELGLVDSFAVVADSHKLLTTRHNIDLYSLCTCVKAVLNQLFHYGCRALHNLACGDLVDQMTGKLLNGHPADYAGLSAPGEDRNAQRLADTDLIVGEFVGPPN